MERSIFSILFRTFLNLGGEVSYTPCTAGDRTSPLPLPHSMLGDVVRVLVESDSRRGVRAGQNSHSTLNGGGGDSIVAGCTPATDITTALARSTVECSAVVLHRLDGPASGGGRGAGGAPGEGSGVRKIKFRKNAGIRIKSYREHN